MRAAAGRRAAIGAAVVCALPVAHRVGAQQPTRPIVVRIRVTDPDSLGASGVAVAITGAGASPIASARTDSAGRASMSFVRHDTLVRVGLRKIGYAASVHDIVLTGTDTFSLAFTLTRSVQQLDTVRADQRRLSNDYIIGAAEIAASKRPLLDAYDAVRLRPQMMGDRMRDCPYVQHLWVNGRHQPLFPQEIIPFTDTPEITFSTPHGVREDGSGRPALRPHAFPLAHASAAYPLALIAPKYIVEIRYTSCTMQPVAGPRSINALFISLKPGVAFDVKRGAYIADSAAARAAGLIP